MSQTTPGAPDQPLIPTAGSPPEAVLAEIEAARTSDADWRAGRTFSLIYNTGDHELEELLEEVSRRFLHENALNPFAFPSLRRFESEVVDATAELLHGVPRAGTLTSGGTESILMAVKTSRDIARAEGRPATNLLVPRSAHPAFAKAAHYLDVEERRIGLGDDLRVDVDAMAAAIDEGTFLLVGSAPCYPYGLIDDITSISELASSRDLLCHVDSCLGGWMLPWWERLGRDQPVFDFRLPGVTSMSADIHKYGYTFKGASTVLYRSREMVRSQYFFFEGWPGGMYGSPAAAGARPAAPIAGAWAVIRHLGEEGYLRFARETLQAFDAYRRGIESIEGLAVTGDPDFCSFEFGPDPEAPEEIDIGAVGDFMDDRGWHVDRQQGGLHLMLSPFHARVVDEFLSDLSEAVAAGGTGRGREATYGGVG